MKYPKQKIKSKFHHHGHYSVSGKTKRTPQKGAFGKTEKPKLEPWQLPDDALTLFLKNVFFADFLLPKKNSYGKPMCEFCKEDYKREKGEDTRFVRRHREAYDDEA